MQTSIARWQIDHDADVTRRRYAQVTQGGQVTCSCNGCRNFSAALDQAFPPAARTVFDQLGIDRSKPAEVFLTGLIDSGLHRYGGWFHFVGRIESGTDAWRQIDKEGKSFKGELEPFSDHFWLGITSRIALLPEPFKDEQVVQLEFETDIPWVIAEPQ